MCTSLEINNNIEIKQQQLILKDIYRDYFINQS